MSYEHRLVEAANGREFYDKIGRDADAQIAALTEKLRAVEAERDEWKRKYETQCAGSMSAHERRIHLEAELRAELERKDAALKAQQAVVDAAREWVETPRFRVDVARGDITPKGLALVAALEKESNAK